MSEQLLNRSYPCPNCGRTVVWQPTTEPRPFEPLGDSHEGYCTHCGRRFVHVEVARADGFKSQGAMIPAAGEATA